MNSRSKGKRGELEFVHFCRDHGIEARRTQQYSGTEGTADVLLPAFPWLHVEVKRTEKFRIYDALEQAEGDAFQAGKLAAVFHRRNRGEWIMVCGGLTGLDLMRAWDNFAEGNE